MKGTPILILLLIIFACSSNKDSVQTMEREFNHETIKEESYERYVLVKGANLNSVEQKLKDWGELSAPGNSYTYQFSKARLGDWILIKMPSDLTDYYTYHNIVYWFLGFPPDDDNYADQSIGLSIDRDSKKSYLLFNDYKLRQKMNLEDDLFGVFENDEKFVLSIPFDEFKEVESADVENFKGFLIKNSIDFEAIKLNNLDYEDFGVLFNEK